MSDAFGLTNPEKALKLAKPLLRAIGVEIRKPSEQRRDASDEICTDDFVLRNPDRTLWLLATTVLAAFLALMISVIVDRVNDHKGALQASLILNFLIVFTATLLCIVLLTYVVHQKNKFSSKDVELRMKLVLGGDNIGNRTGATDCVRRADLASTPSDAEVSMVSDRALEELQAEINRLEEAGADASKAYARHVDRVGEVIYSRIRNSLERSQRRKFVRINVSNGEYIVADTLLLSMQVFEERFGDAPSWGTQIGAGPRD
jgi:hypothetical protein